MVHLVTAENHNHINMNIKLSSVNYMRFNWSVNYLGEVYCGVYSPGEGLLHWNGSRHALVAVLII